MPLDHRSVRQFIATAGSTAALLSFAHASEATPAITPPAPSPTEDSPARRYAQRSTSILGAATFSAGMFGASQQGTGFVATTLTADFAIRMVRFGGLVIE